MVQAEHFITAGSKLGEGPLWHPRQELLYWVDIEGHCFHRFSLETGVQETIPVGQPVGCLAFRESGGLVLALRDGLGFWDPDQKKLEIVQDPEADRENARFNDGRVDRKGRFWAGTLGEDQHSSLYRLDPDGSLQVMESGISISNGIGWSPDNSLMYFTDSPSGVIYVYDFDLEKGSISNPREFVRVPAEAGVPDGLTVDGEGYVWSAHWDGWRVSRYDPDGLVERVIYLPVQRPTSCAFGGSNLDKLFITSAWTGLSESERREQPLAGDLFVYPAEIQGQKESYFKG
ncbi:MAG: SMP-30/gluconolactonase/LRE family protein [Anaerolineales bacterium]|jgi:sugar lactone lactonase YvrE